MSNSTFRHSTAAHRSPKIRCSLTTPPDTYTWYKVSNILRSDIVLTGSTTVEHGLSESDSLPSISVYRLPLISSGGPSRIHGGVPEAAVYRS